MNKTSLIEEVQPGLLRLSLLPFDIGNAYILGTYWWIAAQPLPGGGSCM
jgi:hypothetical protein